MAELTVSGRMSVATLKKGFKEAFGATLRVYNGARFADEKATLASLRGKDAQKVSADFKVNGNMQIGTFEKKFKEVFDIKIGVANYADKFLLKDEETFGEVMKRYKEEGILK
jgi:hypothetical protein